MLLHSVLHFFLITLLSAVILPLCSCILRFLSLLISLGTLGACTRARIRLFMHGKYGMNLLVLILHLLIRSSLRILNGLSHRLFDYALSGFLCLHLTAV